MEPVAVRRAVAVAALAVAVGGVMLWRGAGGSDTASVEERPRSVVPAGTRIRVEVVNATRAHGLARRVTFLLRDAGFDVVRFATDTTLRDSTLVLDRSSHREWSELVARTLGRGRVESRPDSSRYLDVTVVLGADWRSPAKPFYP